MLCIMEDINTPRKRRIVYKFQKSSKEQPSDSNQNDWILPASILGAGGLVGGSLYYLSKKNQHKDDGPSVYDVLGIKKDSPLEPEIDPGIPLNADNWYKKDPILDPKVDPDTPLNMDNWYKKDSILDPEIDPSIPLNADNWYKNDSILGPKVDPDIPLNTDRRKNDSILDPKVDSGVPLNADNW